jgi:hypothetical protein
LPKTFSSEEIRERETSDASSAELRGFLDNSAANVNAR